MKRLGTAIFFGLNAIAGIALAESPDWALKESYAAMPAKVVKVSSNGIADLVAIDTGSQSNIRIGARCMVRREGLYVGDIVIVESRKDKSVGLALDGSVIQTGDAVHITPAN